MPNVWVKLECPECGFPMKLRVSRNGPFYGCERWPECHGTHSAHPNGEPVGIPADGETKLARKAAHEVFDPIWQCGVMSRTEAYDLLSEVMGDGPQHIGAMGIEDCEKLIAGLRQRGYVASQAPARWKVAWKDFRGRHRELGPMTRDKAEQMVENGAQRYPSFGYRVIEVK